LKIQDNKILPLLCQRYSNRSIFLISGLKNKQ